MTAKKLIINIKNADALAHGIKKWKILAGGTNVWPDGRKFEQYDCRLCDINASGGVHENCSQCPIKLDTGERQCRGTAYYAYERRLDYADEDRTKADVRAEAQNMVDYLVDLKSRCTVVARAMNHVEDVE